MVVKIKSEKVVHRIKHPVTLHLSTCFLTSILKYKNHFPYWSSVNTLQRLAWKLLSVTESFWLCLFPFPVKTNKPNKKLNRHFAITGRWKKLLGAGPIQEFILCALKLIFLDPVPELLIFSSIRSKFYLHVYSSLVIYVCAWRIYIYIYI